MNCRRASVVLFNPIIPHNTGAIGRTCLGLNAQFHLIKPLGFAVDDKSVRQPSTLGPYSSLSLLKPALFI